MSLIKFPGKHTAVFGTTQTGKTYAVQKSLMSQKEGVLFFNVNHAPVSNYVRADSKDDLDNVISVLMAGEKINYLPERETRWQEIAAIVEHILDLGGFPVTIVFDECHLMYLNPDKYKRAAQAALEETVTTGLSKGIKAIFITQRPALLDNTLMTQSEFKVFFRTENEGPYLKRYGIPFEDVERMTAKEYHYCTHYRGQIEGAFKV